VTDASPPTVLAILVADAPAEPMRAVETARAVAGRGLEGDRYHDGRGTFLKPGDRGDAPGADPDVPGRHQVTLIEAGVLREAVPGEPQTSYHNIERSGFRPAYVRANYVNRSSATGAARG